LINFDGSLRSIGSYDYNDIGQRDSSEVTRKTVAGSDEAAEWSFDYDNQDQLTFAHQLVDGQESGPQYDYNFDPVGNHTENGGRSTRSIKSLTSPA
jgi:hypothetical protein